MLNFIKSLLFKCNLFARNKLVKHTPNTVNYFLKNGCPQVLCFVGETCCYALVDTGATSCQLAPDIASRINHVIIGDITCSNSAGFEWKAKRAIIKTLNIGETTFKNVEVSIPDKGDGFIIGNNILQQLSFKMDTKAKQLHFN